jgi:hypothetical protein
VVNLDQFLPRMLPYLIGCPEPLAKQALVDAAIEFCGRTNAVSVALDPLSIVEGVATYELEPPAQTSVSTVQRAWYDDKLLGAVPYEQAINIYGSQKGPPSAYYGEFVDEVYSLTLWPTPDESLPDSLRVRAALVPTRSATQLHDLLFDHYADAIVHGAIAAVASIPDQSYTDLKLAAVSAAKARAGALAARGEALRGHVQSSLSVTLRGF